MSNNPLYYWLEHQLSMPYDKVSEKYDIKLYHPNTDTLYLYIHGIAGDGVIYKDSVLVNKLKNSPVSGDYVLFKILNTPRGGVIESMTKMNHDDVVSGNCGCRRN